MFETNGSREERTTGVEQQGRCRIGLIISK